jgi:hypothetical protein
MPYYNPDSRSPGLTDIETTFGFALGMDVQEQPRNKQVPLTLGKGGQKGQQTRAMHGSRMN